MKISYLKEKLIGTAAYLMVILLWGYWGLPCIFQGLFGIPCPGCGMSRAALSILKMDFLAAFRYHPMVWSMPFLYLYFLLDGGLFKRKWADRILLFAIGGGFLAQWIWKLLV